MSGPYIASHNELTPHVQLGPNLYMLQPKLRWYDADPFAETGYLFEDDIDLGTWYVSAYILYELNLTTKQVRLLPNAFPKPASDLVTANGFLYYLTTQGKLAAINPTNGSFSLSVVYYDITLALAEGPNERLLGSMLKPYSGRFNARLATDGSQLFAYVEAAVANVVTRISNHDVLTPVFGSFNVTYDFNTGRTTTSYSMITDPTGQVAKVPNANIWQHCARYPAAGAWSRPFYYRGCIISVAVDTTLDLHLTRLIDGVTVVLPRCGQEAEPLYTDLEDGSIYKPAQTVMAGSVLSLYGEKFTAIDVTGLQGLATPATIVGIGSVLRRCQAPTIVEFGAATLRRAAPPVSDPKLIGVVARTSSVRQTHTIAELQRNGLPSITVTI